MEMLCLMHEAIPRGFLLVNGMPVSERQIASLAGMPIREISSLLDELEGAGVFSRDNGTIYSRRMRRDTDKAERDKEYGKAGGNPRLKARVNPSDKAQKPEARSQIATQQTVSESKAEFDAAAVEAEARAAVGRAAPPETADFSPILELVAKGYDIVKHILPVLRARAGKPVSSWRYFVPAIEESRAANGAIKPNAAAGTSSEPVAWVRAESPQWDVVAERYKSEKKKPLIPRGSTTGTGGSGLGAFVPAAWLAATVN
jgi:hypothetical protein